MIQRVLLCALLLAIVGCSEAVIEEAVPHPFDGLPEEATVINLIHSQAFHGGDSHGKTVIHIVAESCEGCADGEFAAGAPEWFAVVLRCAHGQFIVQDDQELAADLVPRLNEGQRVVVYYEPSISANISRQDGTGSPITVPQYAVQRIEGKHY